MKKIIVFLFCFLFVVTAVGEDRNPRVAEVESALVKDASVFLKGRFPESPFLVTVSVDPLRRQEATAQQHNSEKLPYYEMSDEEIKDEWDDPALTTQALLTRAKKVVVSLSLPTDVNDEEITEIKESLSSVLGLTPARDEIKVQRKAWHVSQVPWPWILACAGLLLAAMVLHFFVSYISSSKISKALVTAGGAGKNSSGGASAPAPAPMSQSSDRDSGAGNAFKGDMKFSDPIKTREIINQSVRLLVEDPAFPTLDDLMTLDRFGEQSPPALGAFLNEFPVDMQKLLFSLSYKDYWLEAFNTPGDLGSESLGLLQRLMRAKRDPHTVEWQKLLIAVWRIGDGRAQFIKALPHDEAFAILNSLPKSISVSIARHAFPGSWGSVLDPSSKEEPFAAEAIERVKSQALKQCPLHEFSILGRYRHERDLLSYLKTVDPLEERDIYGAASPESVIHRLRPPFFPVFDLSEDIVKQMLTVTTIDDWSFAMLNVAKLERKNVEKVFSEKQKFIYIEKLRYLDANPPDKSRVNQARERIGRLIVEMARAAAAKTASANQNTNRDESENEQKVA